MEIKATTIGQAHAKVCQAIFEDGFELITEDGEITYEYSEPVMVIIRHPNMQPKCSSFNNFGEKAMGEYVKQLLSVNDYDFSYIYGNRLFDFPEYKCGYGYTRFGDGDGFGFNQIDWIINMLIKEPNTRRAVAMVRYPEIDCDTNNPPCLTTVQFMIRNNALDMTAYFRSNDMLSAWGNNVYALQALMDYVGTRIVSYGGCGGCGNLTTISNSAHMYFKRDAEEVDRMKIEVYK